MDSVQHKIEIDIQSIPEGKYEATCSFIEGFVAQGTSILETIEQALAAAERD